MTLLDIDSLCHHRMFQPRHLNMRERGHLGSFVKRNENEFSQKGQMSKRKGGRVIKIL